VGSSVAKAVKEDAYNSLEVLGVQFKIGEKNKKFEPIFMAIRKVMQENTNATIEKEIILKDLLPENRLEYYRYNGSLTTPPCNEIVVWTVFKQPIEVSQAQLDDIRRTSYLVVDEREPRYISDNYRSTQPLYERKVEEITTEVRFDAIDLSDSHGNILTSNNFLPLIFFITFFTTILFF
jgi:carbonic anhydrase